MLAIPAAAGAASLDRAEVLGGFAKVMAPLVGSYEAFPEEAELTVGATIARDGSAHDIAFSGLRPHGPEATCLRGVLTRAHWDRGDDDLGVFYQLRLEDAARPRGNLEFRSIAVGARANRRHVGSLERGHPVDGPEAELAEAAGVFETVSRAEAARSSRH